MLKASALGLMVGLVIGAVMIINRPAEDPPKNSKPVAASDVRTAVFAGGCFWCMEPPFEKYDGVIKVESGYTGGTVENPTYDQVCRTETGHYEAVKVTYDVSQIQYKDLVEIFWRSVDPTDAGGQFADRGTSYRTAIFVANETERELAQKSKDNLEASKRFEKPIVTPIIDAATFYLAEDYHQDYYKTNPVRYKLYRNASGRDRFIDDAWGEDRKYVVVPPAPKPGSGKYSKPSDAEIRNKLSSIQYNVTQQEGTEPPFNNEFWDNKKAGIYVDIVSGEPLFSSIDKYKSGTGWPSFTRPLVAENIVERTDYHLIAPRTEVRSKHGDSHLGHVFPDGPQPTGLRYCINSAALKFIPAESLSDENYPEFVELFSEDK